MLEVADALEIVLGRTKPLKPEITALMSSSLGQVIADDIHADVDSPPFDKALMDGYAVRSADVVNGVAELRIVEEVGAGSVPTQTISAGECTALYTGAPLPTGADAVVKKELVAVLADNRIRVNDPSVKPGRHVMARGDEMRTGEVVLPRGTVITPAVFGLCATVGKTAVPCIPPAQVSIFVTGNELVEANRKPRGGQIRNSNGPMLVAQTARAGALPRYLGVGTDDEAVLGSLVREGLLSNVLILSGGVSVGKFDLVPKVLESLGVTIQFHHVRMKPGKPILFGTKGDTLVFGLPGNPVSAFVGFELFVKPALRVLSGKTVAWHPPVRATLAEPFTTSNDRPTYHPAKLHGDKTGATVTPLPWSGSADLRAMLNANALLVLPAGDVRGETGDVMDVMVL